MTTKMKKQGSTDLPRFIVGALATAGASVANGATVQITFANNVLSNTTGFTNFSFDLTGDGVNDIGSFAAGLTSGWTGNVLVAGQAKLSSPPYAKGQFVPGSLYAVVGAAIAAGSTGTTTIAVARNLIPISFTDARINGGFATSGWLDMTASAVIGNASIQVNRLIFDDASPVAPLGVAYTDPAFAEWDPSGVSVIPEPGTNLGLLALGAGGLLIRRRLKRAA